MDKVLIIAFHCPPSGKVGALRTRGLARYLPACGFEPIIITPRLPGPGPDRDCRVIETRPAFRETIKTAAGLGSRPDPAGRARLAAPFRDFRPPYWRQALSLAREAIPYPDTKVGWSEFAFHAARQLVKNEQVRFLVTNAPPFTAHLVGARLKRLFPGLTWVADFRDLWTQNAFRRGARPLRPLNVFYEKTVLAESDALITVSEPWALKMGALHNKPARGIPNGFDPDEQADGHFSATTKLTITYTGTIYKHKQDPAMLFRAIKHLLGNGLLRGGADIEINLYGDGRLAEYAGQAELPGICFYRGRRPRREIIDIQRRSQALLLLDWNAPGEPGVIPAKLFEYLAAKRPILMIGRQRGAAAEIIEQTGSGKHCRDEAAVRKTLTDWHRDQLAHGMVGYQGKQAEIDKYSQVTMAENFAGLLNACRQHRRGR